jgi:transposase
MPAQLKGGAGMARMPSGADLVAQAKAAVAKATSVEELRQAQAVLLPLEHGLSLAQTAAVIGRSVGWTCRLRREFIRLGGTSEEGKPARGGRRHENMTPEQERAVLEPFFEKAAAGGILVVAEIKQAVEDKLGRRVALASVYNLLHRHGWRKIVPDKRHPQADVAAQEEWKKNSPISLPKSTASGQGKGKSD